ncbi:MAG TPA: hypothetical protein VGC86_17175 [Afipia sp.]
MRFVVLRCGFQRCRACVTIVAQRREYFAAQAIIVLAPADSGRRMHASARSTRDTTPHPILDLSGGKPGWVEDIGLCARASRLGKDQISKIKSLRP